MERFISTRSETAGHAPGTPIHIGEPNDSAVRITVFEYDANSCREYTLGAPEQCSELPAPTGVRWINVDGVHDVATVTGICGCFGVHSLVQEDIVNTDQRPKIEEYDGQLFIVAKMLRHADRGESNDAPRAVTVEQVSLLVMEKTVISFQQRPGDVLDPLRNRLRSGKGSVRRRGADYLAYSILDAIADHYFILLEKIEERIAPMEEAAIADPQTETVLEIHRLKRELLLLRKSLWPMREVIYRLSRDDLSLVAAETRPFLRDLYDNVIHVIELIENFQEIISGAMEIYLSSISNRMNNIMKVLTIISTIFIPLTFIAGVYGMNFVYMPELAWSWSYPATLVVMATVAGLMLRFFRRKKWI